MKSETPRTDAEIFRPNRGYEPCVSAEFSKILEKENNRDKKAPESMNSFNLKTDIGALSFLKPGWNNDTKFPAPAINAATREAAKKLVPFLHLLKKTGWTVGPGLDGSILFSAKNIVINIGSTTLHD